MLTEEEFVSSPVVWFDMAQNELYRRVSTFQRKHQYDKAQLAETLDCTPRMTTQLLSGGINCSMEKLCDIASRMGLCIEFRFTTTQAKVKRRAARVKRREARRQTPR